MTNDAKLGLVVGIGLVILIAIVFFRKDPAAPTAAASPPNRVAAMPSPPAVPEPGNGAPPQR